VAWRRIRPPERCRTRTLNSGLHHLAPFRRKPSIGGFGLLRRSISARSHARSRAVPGLRAISFCLLCCFAEREQRALALDYCRSGDVLIVTRLDRLVRSVADLCKILTATPTGKLILNMLGSIAQFERELTLERQREGIAKAKGKANAEAENLQPEPRLPRCASSARPASEIARQVGISRAAVYRAHWPLKLGRSPQIPRVP
jgi:hypothetical protein